MSAPLDDLSDWDFTTRWPAMSGDERDGLSPQERAQAYERYRQLDPYGFGAAAKRGNGDGAKGAVWAAAQREITPAARESNLIDWAALPAEPPAFPWIMEHWLSWHPTLLAGRGGIGKSLLIQQLATALACGLPTWCEAGPPLKVLYWACEDDRDQLHRRQHTICMHHRIGFDALANLYVDARQGLENTLMATEYGRPMWTPRIELLRQQLNDRQIDVLLLDNIAHTFGANENVRYDVTQFVNGICGLVQDRPFCPILLGHPSKSINSEYSGSTAWENAVRMRWYLDDRLPDQKSNGDDLPDPDYRVLAKRKTNYTRLDYIQFRFDNGFLAPELIEDWAAVGGIGTAQRQRSERIIDQSVRRFTELGIRTSSGESSPSYLPRLILQYKLGEGATRAELGAALREAILTGKIKQIEIGKKANRHPSFSLCFASTPP